MKLVSVLVVVTLFAGCQTGGQTYSANKQHAGVAQFSATTSYAGPESAGSVPSANKQAAGVAQFASKPSQANEPAAAAETPEVAAQPVDEAAPAASADCPAVVLKSGAAEAQPCLTTEAFVQTLKLSKAQKLRAMQGIEAARNAAH